MEAEGEGHGSFRVHFSFVTVDELISENGQEMKK